MKLITLATLLMMTTPVCAQHDQTEQNDFKAKRISKTASFIIHANINHVFPLYGAFEERKWAPGWEPVLIYPENEIIEEGTTFRVKPHGHEGEGASLWIVSKYEPGNYLIQYLVSTENRFWTITVSNKPIEDNTKTKTTVTYSYTGLTKIGNALNQKSLEKMYENNLQDWAGLINGYLEGKSIESGQ